MSKVARSLALIALALVALVVGAPPAQASFHGQVCQTWNHGAGEAKICAIVNQSDSGNSLEALSRFIRSDAPTVGYFSVEIDYVRLVKNGNVVAALEANAGYTLSGSWQERSTGWTCAGSTNGWFHARVRYQFTHWHQVGLPDMSGFLIVNSQNWYGRGCGL
jgi:hypothetical protein